MSSAALRAVPIDARPAVDVARVGMAAQPAPESRSSTPAGKPRRVLRMLSGPHTGAESELTSDRLLIGNLESECDVVIDVSRPERHICLVRASADGWTVLSIAGNLWVGEDHLEPQQTRDIDSGLVLTLGRVAFCIADASQIDWSAVKPPANLVIPEPTGPVPIVVLPVSGEAKLRKWHAAKLAAGIGISALTIASAGAYLTTALNIRVPGVEEAAAKLKNDQTLVAALPFGKELLLQPDPGTPNHMQVGGYLPRREQAKLLEKALRDAGIDAETRFAAVDEMTGDLARRFNGTKPANVHYGDLGRFNIDSRSELLDIHDREARQTLQEMHAVTAVGLSVEDVLDSAGKPIVVRYERSTDHPGDILVSDLDVIRQRQRYVIKEIRLGAMPSIVLENGMRLFEGAAMPDGSVLRRIGASELVVAQGRGERVIPLPADAKAPSRP